MPKNYKGLDWTVDQLVKGQGRDINLLDTVFQELDEKRDESMNLNITMPRFSIDSTINAVKHLRNVSF